jgi:hypothetical protein
MMPQLMDRGEQSAPALVDALKDAFRRAFTADVESGLLRSVFLIGSKSQAAPPYAAGDASQLESYVDFDVHFLIDRGALAPEELDTIRERVDAICDDFARPRVCVGWGVRDRHWKLVPEADKVNICIHVVVCNRYDYECRALHQPVLGSNMYELCEALVGEHPGRLLPTLPPTGAELLYSAGGAAWMLEQFHRALLLHWWAPAEQDFMPYLSGYCWNVASSIMLELYSAKTHAVNTRRGARRWLLEEAGVPKDIAAQLELLHHYREIPEIDDRLGYQLVNAAFVTSHWMIEQLHDAVGLPRPSIVREQVLCRRDLHSESISAAFDRPVNLQEVHVAIDPSGDAALQLQRLAATIRDAHENVSPSELPEFIAEVAHKGQRRATKLTIWTPHTLTRYQLSDDLAFSRERPTLWAAQWGWESGSQGLLQRLHERHLDRHTLLRNRRSVRGTEPERQIACAYSRIAMDQFRALGIQVPEPGGDSFFDQVRYLADVTNPGALPAAAIGAKPS